MGHAYIPSPPSPPPPTLPVPPAFQSPPVPIVNTASNQPLPGNSAAAVAPAPTGGNGQIWCSSPSSPGWDTNKVDGGCGTHKASSTSTVLRLDQLPFTGSNDIAYFTFIGALLVFSIVLAYYLTNAIYRTWVH